jgi:transposase InsO family protein
MDFLGPLWNSKWLVLVDAKSKFPVVVDMGNNTSGTNLIQALEQVIDWFGPPQTLVSDNGPPFNSYELIQFYDKYGINHVTTAPYHPASNGLAERFVRSFKEALLKEQSKTNPTYLSLESSYNYW